jgi:hypothetical protein
MPLWTPAVIDTALWLDASDATTITESGGLVSEWRDKSGLDRHASNTDPASQPALTAAGMNGLDCLTFMDDLLNAPGVHITTNAMFFIVASLENTSDNFGRLLSLRKTGNANDYDNTASIIPVIRNSTSSGVGLYASSALRSSATASYATNMLMGSVVNTTQVQFFLNGTGGALANYTHALDTSDGLRIGEGLTSGADFWNGKVAEVVIVEGADTDTRQIIEGYLAWKWGLEANLPTGHPYKSAAPATYSVSGTITDATGTPCQRDIVVLDRVTKQIAATTTSDPTTGAYSASLMSANEVAVIALDDAAGTTYNDVVARVVPT